MNEIKIGIPLLLETNKDNQEQPEKYRCKIVDYKDGYLYIDYPVNYITKRTGFFMEGTQFQASFVGEDQSVYWFETEVVARKKLNIPVIVLTFPGIDKLVRIQRRKFVRIETALDMAVKHPEFHITTITYDISGGGAAILQPAQYNLLPGEELDLTFVIHMNSGEQHYVETNGTVVRMIEQKNSSQLRASIEFKELNDHHRQKIIQYCFEQQMNQKKRLLT